MGFEKIKDFYNKRLKYNENYIVLHWRSEQTQHYRLKKMYSFCYGKILDFGCGLGDLINVTNIDSKNYYGVDINENLIKRCIETYPNYKFKVINHHKTEDFGEFDWWFACGLFTLHTTDEDLLETIDYFYKKTKHGLIFTLFDGIYKPLFRGFDLKKLKNIFNKRYNRCNFIDIYHKEKIIIIEK